MTYRAVASVLNRSMGLDAASIGPAALASAVQGRMAACGLASPDAYAAALEASDPELRALIEAVVVPETWFFRDREAFATVAELALQRAGKLRLISLPCSTGEEPYSLAMTLLDAGLPPDAFEIHAFDISRAAIDRALAGVYGRNSFRSADLAFRARHFVQAPEGWRIRPEVAACVRFAQANILEIEAATTRESYDVVFCRNLIIYFDSATQQRAIRTLGGLMRPGGLVFVGPGDANLMLGAGFASAQRPLTFAFRAAAPRAAPASVPLARRRPKVSTPVAPPPMPARRAFSTTTTTTPAPGAPGQPASALAEARRLADLGRIGDAIRACETHLRQAGSSADAWRLLGVLCEAGGEPSRAADCYRKALYLDPADAETLDHLALLLQRQGDVAGASLVWARARRLNAREAS